ncbi:nucleoside-diphosphate-sugar epimerase [Undibacterium sp. GrIS 1.2]|uniref:NAD-dependent epimerase/dehydratase family protein n=1 Tax=Undibacterium sp. GrIS 1.2 TaxID=3143933 RepID=UPI003398BD97
MADAKKLSALITGASGFVGYRLAERLLEEGWKIRLLVRDAKKLASPLNTRCEVIIGDLNDVAAVSRAVRDVNVIFHCAANVNTWDNSDAYYAANVLGVTTLMTAITKENKTLARLVHVSTMDVYGFPAVACNEMSTPNGAGFGYGESKLMGESVVRELGSQAGISYTIIRPGNIIGPRSQFITRIGAELKFGIMLTVDKGQVHAGLVYIDNLIDCLIWASSAHEAHRECYNVRDNYDVSWRTFIDKFRSDINGKGFVFNLSFSAAEKLARGLETFHKLLLPRHEPMLHRLLVRFFGRTCGHSADRIHFFCPTKVGFEEAMQDSIQWFLKQSKKY